MDLVAALELRVELDQFFADWKSGIALDMFAVERERRGILYKES